MYQILFTAVKNDKCYYMTHNYGSFNVIWYSIIKDEKEYVSFIQLFTSKLKNKKRKEEMNESKNCSYNFDGVFIKIY